MRGIRTRLAKSCQDWGSKFNMTDASTQKNQKIVVGISPISNNPSAPKSPPDPTTSDLSTRVPTHLGGLITALMGGRLHRTRGKVHRGVDVNALLPIWAHLRTTSIRSLRESITRDCANVKGG